MKPCSLARRRGTRAVRPRSPRSPRPRPAYAARVGVLSNKYATETAADFNARIPTHVFTGDRHLRGRPDAAVADQNAFDVILVFEDSTYGNATAVGNVAAAFANTGRAVVIGAFYDQDRSDGPPVNSPHGWGALEQIDPNTTDGTGTPYAPRTLDTATMLAHPLTDGHHVAHERQVRGRQPGQAGHHGRRLLGPAECAGQRRPRDRLPHHRRRVRDPCSPSRRTIRSLGVAGTDFSGDFHRAWKNAFDFGADRCVALGD